jgi:hypothetical protein
VTIEVAPLMAPLQILIFFGIISFVAIKTYLRWYNLESI